MFASRLPLSVVPLSNTVVAALAEYLRRYPTGLDGFVFTTERGAPISRSTATLLWSRHRAAAGLPDSARGFHLCRHACASILISAGVSIRAVAGHLGHADVSETLNTYAHLMPDDDARTRSAIEKALGGADSAEVAS